MCYSSKKRNSAKITKVREIERNGKKVIDFFLHYFVITRFTKSRMERERHWHFAQQQSKDQY